MPVKTTKRITSQVLLASATLTPVYTVPKATNFENSSIKICNQSGAARTFRLSIAKAGESDTPAQYEYFNTPLPRDTTATITDEIFLQENDVIRVYASGNNVSVNVIGIEIG